MHYVNAELFFPLEFFRNNIIMPVKRPAILSFCLSVITGNEEKKLYDGNTQVTRSVLLSIFREHTILLPTGTWLML